MPLMRQNHSAVCKGVLIEDLCADVSRTLVCQSWMLEVANIRCDDVTLFISYVMTVVQDIARRKRPRKRYSPVLDKASCIVDSAANVLAPDHKRILICSSGLDHFPIVRIFRCHMLSARDNDEVENFGGFNLEVFIAMELRNCTKRRLR